MHLITVAHFQEAQTLIQDFKLNKITNNLYQGDLFLLLLTGEGPFEAATKTSLIVGKYNITKITNLGIAGSLSPDYQPGDFLKVRTLYLVHDETPFYKSFPLGSSGVDCVTSFERILSAKKAQKLKGMAQLVDREAWGGAMAAKMCQLPFDCYKLVSDQAGSLGACELVREKAQDFSQELSAKLSKLLEINVSRQESFPDLPGLHFTFSTRHQFQNLLEKLSVKYHTSSQEVLNRLNLESITSLEISPKERTKKVLEKMMNLLDPLRATIDLQIKKLKEDFKKNAFDLKTDPLLEDPKVTLSFEVATDEELKTKADELKKLSLRPWKNLMEGKIHVE